MTLPSLAGLAPWRSLVLAARSLRRAPSFTLIAVLTLASGVGLATAMFTFVNGIWLRAVPYRSPDRLVVVLGTNPARGLTEDGISLADATDLRRASRTLEDLALFWTERVSLAGPAAQALGEPQRVKGARVSGNLLSVLGVQTLLGRTFVAADDRPGAERVAILGHGLWQRAFGGSPAALGASILVEGRTFTVVGVLAPGLRFPDGDPAEIFYPVARDPASMPRQGRPFGAVARLADGVTLEAARAELAGLAAALAREYPQTNAGWSVAVSPLGTYRTRGFEPFLLLWAAVALLWLIACANLASLLLQRNAGRVREAAIRLALGGGTARLVSAVFAESLVVALAGSALGLALARGVVLAALAAVPLEARAGVDFPLDARVVAFAALAALVSAVVFGALPALRLGGLDLAGALKEGSLAVAGGVRRDRLRRALVAGEVALAVALLVGALLLGRSFRALAAVDPGFRAEGTLALDLTLADARYPEPQQRVAFYEQALARVRALPGVLAVGFGSRLPLAGGYTTEVRTAEQSAEQGTANPAVGFQFIAGDALRALGVPLLRGRLLAEGGGQSTAAGEVLVSARLAATLWPDQEAVGKRLVVPLMRSPTPFVVVGVAGDVLRGGLDAEAGRDVYLPYRLRAMGGMQLFVRAAGDARRLVPALRRELRALDPTLPVSDVRPLTELVESTLWLRKVSSALFLLLAASALALTAVGIYGLIATSLRERRRELAIRAALGAGRGVLVRLVAGQAVALAGVGIASGLGAAWIASSLVAHFLFSVTPTDASTYALAGLGLLLVATLAGVVPAAAATRDRPAAALRAQ